MIEPLIKTIEGAVWPGGGIPDFRARDGIVVAAGKTLNVTQGQRQTREVNRGATRRR